MGKVFISYIREDKEHIVRIEKFLKQQGVDLWIDIHELIPGSFFQPNIRIAINDSDFFIACFSDKYEAKKNSYALKELKLACKIMKAKIPYERWLIPVKLNNCNIPAIKINQNSTIDKQIQWINLFNNWQKGLNQLLRTILIINYFKRLHEVTEAGSFGFDIYTLPINLTYGKSKRFEGIKTLLKSANKRIILIGSPASGKSTAIKRILGQAINQEGTLVIPILLSVDLLTKGKLINHLSETLRVKSSVIIEDLMQHCKFLFIIDGLNEYDHIEFLCKKIQRFSDYIDPNYVFITCRSHEYQSVAKSQLRSFECIEIKEYSKKDQIEFIKTKSFDRRSNPKLLKIFADKKNEALIKVCSNQFIFLMVLKLLSNNELPPKLSSDIYRNFLENYFLDWMNDAIELELSKKIILLEKIAVFIGSYSQKSVFISHEDLIKIIRTFKINYPQAIIEELLKNALIIETNKRYRFFQETFQEYLIASWMIRKSILPLNISKINDQWKFDNLVVSDFSKRFYIEMSKMIEFINDSVYNKKSFYPDQQNQGFQTF
jgi:hypothetical protein